MKAIKRNPGLNTGKLVQIVALLPRFEHKYDVELRIKNLIFYTNRITYDYISDGMVYANNVEMDIDDFIDILRRWTD